MTQTWHDLLFAHWPIPAAGLRSLVPKQLPLDTFDGSCWIGVVPFHMSHIRRRGVPPLPGLSRFPELNVRTYVNIDGKPGVYFFSLDAANRVAVWAARRFYHLPYYFARMAVQQQGQWIGYESSRQSKVADFRARYRPLAPVQLRAPGSLESWLTERYCLYTSVNGSVFRAEVHHRQWPLQDAECEIRVNTVAAAAGVALPPLPPLLHFSRTLEVLVWPLRLLS